jgi:hypothetical protein
MKCADCKRPILKPALTIGACNFGPICARRYYALPTRTPTPVVGKRPRAAVPVDPAQLALELEMA